MYALSQNETNDDAVARAIDALPSCYGKALDDCLNEGNAAGLMPVARCNTINAGYDVDWDAVEAAVDALPYCTEPKADVGPMMAAGAAGLAIGLIVAAGVRK